MSYKHGILNDELKVTHSELKQAGYKGGFLTVQMGGNGLGELGDVRESEVSGVAAQEGRASENVAYSPYLKRC
jgi:hypothetical protein